MNYEKMFILNLRFGVHWCYKCKSTTITTPMCGTLKGKIYDENNLLLTNSTLSFYTKGIFAITPSEDGSYSVRVFSYKNRISQLFYNDGSS